MKTLRNGQKCFALDSTGKKCSRPATHYENYHGDHEIYAGYSNDRPTWVRVAFCEKHRCEKEKR